MIIRKSLLQAIKDGNIEEVSRLLLSESIDSEILQRAILEVTTSFLDTRLLLLFITHPKLQAWTSTIPPLRIEIDLRTILYPDRYNSALTEAIKNDDLSSTLALLEDPRAKDKYGYRSVPAALNIAAELGSGKVIRRILDQYNIDQSDYARAVNISIQHSKNVDALKELLFRSSAGILDYHIVIPIESSVSFSEGRYTQQDIIYIITRDCEVNDCLFNLLLREIILRREDLEYYIDWMITQLSREDTSQEVRDLISDAADSVLSSNRVIHSSPEFTAYSGFLLLANSREKDIEAIINTLEDEDEVTEEGIKLARMILGAFDGRIR